MPTTLNIASERMWIVPICHSILKINENFSGFFVKIVRKTRIFKFHNFKQGKKLQPYENDSKHRAAVENEVHDSSRSSSVFRLL